MKKIENMDNVSRTFYQVYSIFMEVNKDKTIFYI